MKKNILVVTLIIFSSLTIMAQKQNNENPLLQKWNTPHNTPPFDKIKNEHYSPAFDVAFAENKKEVDAICNNRARPDFENTIEALEQSGELLNKISGIFYNLMECESSD